VVRQVVSDGSGDAAQLIQHRASSGKVAKPWFNTRSGSASCVRNTPNAMPSWHQAVYLLWWPSLTKHCKQDHSMLEWYDRHRA